MEQADIGLTGLAVMGQNLVLNMARHGYRVAVHNRTVETMRAFVAEHPEAGLVGCASLAELAAALSRPRRVLIMVQAGPAVDQVIGQLVPLLEPGDLIADCGNSHFQDTERRARELAAQGLRFLGVGVSGGEEGALWGPSIMPGGDGYPLVREVFERIAARYDGEPCVAYIGPRGAGHYVKMVHNGIEYADMQLIAEAYDLLQRGLGLAAAEMSAIFRRWNEGELQSYLIEITADILGRIDDLTGRPLVDLILDEAQQKGTGRWTSQNALELGVPTPTINAAVESRILSAYKAERVAASTLLSGPAMRPALGEGEPVAAIGEALYAAKIIAYAQGMALLRAASREYGYELDYGTVAALWRAGCIIRARLLDHLRAAYRRTPDLPNLLLDEGFRAELQRRQGALRQVVAAAAEAGLPCPATASALAYYDAYRSERLPANLTQAQRDYFGAHTYRRVDREGAFHTEWGASEAERRC